MDSAARFADEQIGSQADAFFPFVPLSFSRSLSPSPPAVSHSTTFSVTVNTELGCAARPFRTGPPDIRPGHHARPMPGPGAREGVQSDTTRRARRRVLHGGTHVIGESGRHQEPSSMLLHEGCALLAAGARKVVLLADCGSPHLRKRCAETGRYKAALADLVWSAGNCRRASSFPLREFRLAAAISIDSPIDLMALSVI